MWNHREPGKERSSPPCGCWPACWRSPYQDAAGLWEVSPPQAGSYQDRCCRWWDVSDVLSWPGVRTSLRVVRSEESWTVKRQLTKQATAQTTHWVWLTT